MVVSGGSTCACLFHPNSRKIRTLELKFCKLVGKIKTRYYLLGEKKQNNNIHKNIKKIGKGVNNLSIQRSNSINYVQLMG